jgi:hypothetical protein
VPEFQGKVETAGIEPAQDSRREFPEIERLRGTVHRQTPDGGDVPLADAEQAVRDAVERVAAHTFEVSLAAREATIREQAVRECVEALRENARLYGDPMYTALMNAAEFLARTMLGGEDAPRTHTQECEDHRFIVHAGTGDDADCICGEVEQDAR